MAQEMPREDFDFETSLKEEVREPKRYKVLLHNDDYTTMEFVVRVLKEVFHKNDAEATYIMLSVHNKGLGVCGVYPLEVAETKVSLVHKRSREAGFPLKCSLEEV
jgi:ATP-dependent Clp protease adaptor protein ClpS